MPPLIDLTGKTYGKLKVLERDNDYVTPKGNHYVMWKCECKCENKTIVSVRGDYLKNGNTTSCGCVKRESIHKKQRNSIDITGEKFGLLTAKYYVRSGKQGTIWHCECECGGSVDTYVGNLRCGNIKSCGCLERQNRDMQHEKLRKLNVHGTNLGIITKKEPNKNSTTGIRGVSWCTSKQKYIAAINFQGKPYYLCSSKDKEVCKKARKEAEEQLFDKFLDWYKNRTSKRD